MKCNIRRILLCFCMFYVVSAFSQKREFSKYSMLDFPVNTKQLETILINFNNNLSNYTIKPNDSTLVKWYPLMEHIYVESVVEKIVKDEYENEVNRCGFYLVKNDIIHSFTFLYFLINDGNIIVVKEFTKTWYDSNLKIWVEDSSIYTKEEKEYISKFFKSK